MIFLCAISGTRRYLICGFGLEWGYERPAKVDMASFRFQPDKALEAILYVVSKAHTDKYKTLKILYLADKLHLQRYGRFISGDYYHALKSGPTPMASYDLIQFAAGKKDRCQVDGVRESLKAGGLLNRNNLQVLREPDLDVFSDSDIECLDEVISMLDGVPAHRKHAPIWDDVHDAAWKEVWERNKNGPISIEIIASQFPNSEELIEFLRTA